MAYTNPTANASLPVEMGAYVLMTSYHCAERQDADANDYWHVTKDLRAQAAVTPDNHWAMSGQAANDTAWAIGTIGHGEDVYTWSLASPNVIMDESAYYHGPARGPVDQAMPHQDQTWGDAEGQKGWVRHYYADGVAYHWDGWTYEGCTFDEPFDLSVSARTQVKLALSRVCGLLRST